MNSIPLQEEIQSIRSESEISKVSQELADAVLSETDTQIESPVDFFTPEPTEQAEKDSVTASEYLFTWLQHPEVDPHEYDAIDEQARIDDLLLTEAEDVNYLVDEEDLTDDDIEEIVEEEEDFEALESKINIPTSSNTSDEEEESKPKLYRPFYLKWCFGINIHGVLNLTTRRRTKIFIAESHVGIIYDYVDKSMQHLDGHQQRISSVVCDATGKWVATSDCGKADTAIIVWDTEKKIAICTIFNPFGKGISAIKIALSSCGRYLAAVSNGQTARVKFWLWTFGKDQADDEISISNKYGEAFKVSFNPTTPENFFVAFKKRIFFSAWDPVAKELKKSSAPPIRGLKLSGYITDCTYIERCHHVVASTVNGCILFFGNYIYSREYNETEENNNKFFVKAVRVSKKRINCVTSVDGLIVTGGEDGTIVFYDMMLKLLHWISGSEYASIHQIYFNLDQRLYNLETRNQFDHDYFKIDSPRKIIEESYYEDKSEEYETLFLGSVPIDATLQRKPFIVRNFIIVTNDGNISLVDYIKRSRDPLFFKVEECVTSMDTHSECPYICIAYKNNRINLIDYEKMELAVTARDIIKYTHGDSEERKLIPINYIKYSPKSLYLACGLADGTLYLLDPILLTKRQTFSFAHSQIEKICWSYDHKYLAYYDFNHTTCLMKFNDKHEWEFCGKSRLHYRNICDMIFSEDEPSRLYTISDDRCIVQYDIPNSGAGIIRTLDRERIEQANEPSAIIFYPKSTNVMERYLFMADKQQKLKKINEKTKICRSVIQGPTSGCYGESPIFKMEVLPKFNNKYMIFMTDRHLGVHILPPCGNPYKYVSCIGHPTKLKDFCTTYDKKVVFTCGVDDPCVLMWEINTPAAEIMFRLGGEELSPFYSLIEGGAGGWLFKEIQDLFYYMQILHNGENSMLPRQISNRIPVKEIPDLMRAIGFYPTEYEIETILIDVKYREYDQTKKLKDALTFAEFVILYINHRPAYGIGWGVLNNHFLILCRLVEDDDTAEIMSRSKFVEVICDIGELFTRNSANKCLSVLMHFKHEDGFDQDFFEYLPEWIDFSCFVNTILGVELNEEGESRMSYILRKNSSVGFSK